MPLDLFDSLSGKRPKGVPPRGKVFVGYGDYVRQGQKFLDYFKTYGGLKPEHHVLDVGCGIGRMAYPMTRYLTEQGSYDGFDIVKDGIDWCNKNISVQYPNFRFLHIDLYNQLYNTQTRSSADNFRFPYPDESFNFVFLTSVFTHMMPSEVSHYFNEISRVMKPGGTCFASFFLLNDESEALLKQQPTHMNFPIDKGFYRLHSSRVNTANIAFKEEWVKDEVKKSGLAMNSIHYGGWCPRKEFLDYQDIIICSKSMNAPE
ncbi:MAG: class I SAM-dependent methyltransferase [Bacteroidales bacterium]|nr:class I SAM-dependent methyltransferase [Bacteroidales bacterium]